MGTHARSRWILVFLAAASLILATHCGKERKHPSAPTNTAPMACFGVTPSSGTTDTEYTFDASCSSDEEDPASSLRVRWDFETDGTWDTEWSTAKSVLRRFAAAGARTVTVEVRDTGELTDSTSHSVEVQVANTSPTACFTMDLSSGTVGTQFHLDASCCQDAQEPLLSLHVRWDWENDGNWDTDYTATKTANHNYTSPGIKTIRLEVKDSYGLAGQVTHQVTVSNASPTASFSVTPPSGPISTSFQADASASTDLEDPPSALQVRWDWEDDGNWDTDYTTSTTATHTYTSPGIKTIRMEVKDTQDLTDQITHQVTVNNTAPTANFIAAPSSGPIATLFQVDASGSTDPEEQSSTLQVRWDWEDDGNWDTDYTTSKAATHTYTSPGIKTIRMEVKDTQDLTDQITHQVTVNNTAPTAAFVATPIAGTTTTSFHVDASDSADPEEQTSTLQVRWDWEDDGNWDTDYMTAKIADHTYSSVGTKTIRLDVKDTQGLAGQVTHNVMVGIAPEASFTALPPSGPVSAAFLFDASVSFDPDGPADALQFRWDWEDDGTWDTAYTANELASHTYASLGTKTIRLEVKEPDGLTDQATRAGHGRSGSNAGVCGGRDNLANGSLFGPVFCHHCECAQRWSAHGLG